MQARVCLYMEDWQQALSYARQAIAEQPLAQGNSYLAMFDDLSQQGEAIFRLSGSKMNGYLKSFYDNSCMPADTLLSLFDADDLRLRLLRTTTGAKRCRKYSATKVPDNEPKRDDPFIFRLSEMYLTAAEAACQLGQYAEARQYIRAIIERAVGADKADDVMDATLDAQLLQLVRRERVKELCFEGHRWFDLLRNKRLKAVMTAHFNHRTPGLSPLHQGSDNGMVVADDKAQSGTPSVWRYEDNVLFPIPYDQIQLTDWDQNPGY